jgi:hypothetical protein
LVVIAVAVAVSKFGLDILWPVPGDAVDYVSKGTTGWEERLLFIRYAMTGLLVKSSWAQMPDVVSLRASFVLLEFSLFQFDMGSSSSSSSSNRLNSFALGLLLMFGIRGHRGTRWAAEELVQMQFWNMSTAAILETLIRAEESEFTWRRQHGDGWCSHSEGRFRTCTGRHWLRAAEHATEDLEICVELVAHFLATVQSSPELLSGQLLQLVTSLAGKFPLSLGPKDVLRYASQYTCQAFVRCLWPHGCN